MDDKKPQSAAEIVRQLRIWIATKGGGRSTWSIAEELGIPLHRFKKAMLGKDDLKEYRLPILGFLATVEYKEKQKTDVKSQKLSEAIPVFKPKNRLGIGILPASLKQELREQQRPLLDAIERPSVFCAITEREITKIQCQTLQGKDECFGCGAPSRFCRACLLRPVSFPEVDLCTKCLTEELPSENEVAQKGLPSIHPMVSVICHLANRKIPQTACRAMQSETCGTCGAPSRLCTKCKSRRVYYPEYGLCLSCTVSEYWSEREFQPIAPLDEEEDRVLKLILQYLTDLSKVDGRIGKVKSDKIPPSQNKLPDVVFTEEELYINFKTFIEEQGKAFFSVKAYLNGFKHFLRFFQAKGKELKAKEFQAVTTDFLNEFVNLGRTENTLASSGTAMKRRAALLHFFNLLKTKGFAETNPALSLRISSHQEKRKRQVLAPKDIISLLDCAANAGKGRYRRRNAAIFTTLIYTGIKVSELANLKLAMFDKKARMFRRVIGKNNRIFDVMLPKILIPYLKDWLKERKKWSFKENNDALFVSNKGGNPLTIRMIEQICKFVSEKALGWRIPPETLRDNFVYNLFRAGASHQFIQDILGLNSRQLPEFNEELTKSDRRKIIENAAQFTVSSAGCYESKEHKLPQIRQRLSLLTELYRNAQDNNNDEVADALLWVIEEICQSYNIQLQKKPP